MPTFRVLMGSNSNATTALTEAREKLERAFPEDILFSENLESVAVNKDGNTTSVSANYLNALCLAKTELALGDVQSLLKKMEEEMGRVRGLASGLVSIDLDLVEWNGEIVRPNEAAQSYYQECLKSLNKF